MRLSNVLTRSVYVTAISLAGSAFGFALQLILAAKFGLGREVDAYFYSMSLPLFVAGLVGIMLSYVVVPQIVIREANDAGQDEYAQDIANGTVIAATIIGFLGVLLSGFETNSLPSGAAIISTPNLRPLLAMAWLASAGQIVLSSYSSILNGYRKHMLASAILLGAPLGAIVAAALFAESVGVYIIPAGNLLGSFVAIMGVLYFANLRIRIFAPRIGVLRSVKLTLADAPYTAMAMSCFSIYAVIDAFWGPRAGPGALSVLSYSHRVLIATGNLIVVGPSAILIPHLAAHVRNGGVAEFRKLFLRIIFIVAIGAGALALMLFELAPWLVHELFVHSAFTVGNAVELAGTIRRMAFGMLCMLISVVALRALYCLPNVRVIGAIAGVGWALLYFALSARFHRQGADGIAAAYSATWMIFCSVAVFVVYMRASRIAVNFPISSPD